MTRRIVDHKSKTNCFTFVKMPSYIVKYAFYNGKTSCLTFKDAYDTFGKSIMLSKYLCFKYLTRIMILLH